MSTANLPVSLQDLFVYIQKEPVIQMPVGVWFSFIIHSVVSYGRVHNLFQSEFSTQCELVLSLSVYRILSFPSGHPLAGCISFLVFPPLFPSIFLQ
jgi:hypothetical protein